MGDGPRVGIRSHTRGHALAGRFGMVKQSSATWACSGRTTPKPLLYLTAGGQCWRPGAPSRRPTDRGPDGRLAAVTKSMQYGRPRLSIDSSQRPRDSSPRCGPPSTVTGPVNAAAVRRGRGRVSQPLQPRQKREIATRNGAHVRVEEPDRSPRQEADGPADATPQRRPGDRHGGRVTNCAESPSRQVLTAARSQARRQAVADAEAAPLSGVRDHRLPARAQRGRTDHGRPQGPGARQATPALCVPGRVRRPHSGFTRAVVGAATGPPTGFGSEPRAGGRLDPTALLQRAVRARGRLVIDPAEGSVVSGRATAWSGGGAPTRPATRGRRRPLGPHVRPHAAGRSTTTLLSVPGRRHPVRSTSRPGTGSFGTSTGQHGHPPPTDQLAVWPACARCSSTLHQRHEMSTAPRDHPDMFLASTQVGGRHPRPSDGGDILVLR